MLLNVNEGPYHLGVWEYGFNHFRIKTIQAGSTSDVDNILIRDLDTNETVYSNNFEDNNLSGLYLRHNPVPNATTEPQHATLPNITDEVEDYSKTRIVSGKLRLETVGFNQNGSGGYNSYSYVINENPLPKNFELEIDSTRKQWAGAHHFHIFQTIDIAEQGGESLLYPSNLVFQSTMGGSTLNSAYIYNPSILNIRTGPNVSHPTFNYRLIKRGSTLDYYVNGDFHGQTDALYRYESNLSIAENQAIGTQIGSFNSVDPDGDDLTYQFVSGAGDGNNSLFTLDTNGTLRAATIFDFETNASTYTIRVQAKDEYNATVEGNFTVRLTDIFDNSVPTNLNSTAPLTFAENQAIGTIVGEFNATDLDANSTLTYHLVSGAGDGNNSLFTLETNGTLKTAATFDYESNASSYSIRVQAKDEFNATVEGNFTVALLDLYELNYDKDSFQNTINNLPSLNVSEVFVSGNSSNLNLIGSISIPNTLEVKIHSKGDLIISGSLSMNSEQDLILEAGGDIYINGGIFSKEDSGRLFLKFGLNSTNENNPNDYFINSPVNLPDGQNLLIKQGKDGNLTTYTVLTELGVQNSLTGIDLQGVKGNLSANYALGADLNASTTISWNGGSGFEPIGTASTPFSGNFEGLGHTIENLHIQRTSIDKVALFGRTFGSKISNLGVVNANIRGKREVSALIASSSNSLISRCFSSGTVNGADENVAGLLAGIYGSTVINSYSHANATGTMFDVGGLGGELGSATIQNCYSTGKPQGGSRVGGLVGVTFSASQIQNSFWDKQTSSRTTWGIDYHGASSVAAIGLTTIEMKSQTRFLNAGWDFNNTWVMPENDYPILRWQIRNSPPANLNSTAPLAFAENQPIGTIVGEFNATDPDVNSTLTYHLVSGAGDGNNSLFTLETNGTLKTAITFDYESNASNYAIRLQAKDEFNATVEGNFTVTLTDIFENSVPTNLNSTASLTFAENQAIGTIVSEFNATDPDLNATLTYYLVAGVGDGNNSLFTMEANGSLKTATPFDFENNASSYSIRVQARDEYNATVEANFTIVLEDLFEDADLDGFSDSDELNAGTNPADQNSKPGNEFGMLAKYEFDGNASDSSGNNRHGSSEGIVQTPQHDGVGGGGVDFMGNNQSLIVLPSLPIMETSFSIMGWVKADSAGGKVFSVGNSVWPNPSSNENGIFINSESNGSISFGTGDSSNLANAIMPTGKWFHLSAVFNRYSKKAQLYVDGVLQSEVILSGGFEREAFEKIKMPLFELDLSNGAAKGGGRHVVRAQTMDTGTTGGSFSFRVNNGTAGDIFRVWMGEVCVFSAGPAFTGPDHTKQYNDNGPRTFFSNGKTINTEDVNFAYPGNGWRTTGSAANDDDDLIEVYFGPGQPTTYTITVGASNNDGSGMSAVNSFDPATGLYDVVLTNDLNASFNSNLLTLQSETTSIGIVYEEGADANNGADGLPRTGVTFTPQFFPSFGHEFNGSLDRFRIYDRFLHPYEIINFYNSEKPNTFPIELNSTTTLSIAENQLIGTIVGEFNATDSDVNSTLSYYLVSGAGDGNNSLFSLDTNGTLKTATVFDYETNASTYSIRVQAKDEHNATVEGNFTVTLTDVFDNQAPGAISIQFASLTENQPIGTVVGKLNAVDPEAGLVRYSLVNGSGSSGNQFFTVDPTGVLRTAVVFDFEQNASHSIRGRAMDEFNASREEVLNIQVSNQWEDPDGDGLENSYDPDDDNDGFSDIVEIAYGSDPLDPNSLPNRAPSEISLSSDRVEENMPIGTMVGQLRTIDFDDPNGTGVYQYSILTNATGAEFFSLDSNGTMLTKQKLDFESNSSHTIALRVTDNLGAHLDQNLTIQVVDTFIPIVETANPVDVGFQEAMLSGKLLDKGSSMDLIQIGMLVSTDPNPNLNTKGIIRERGFLDTNQTFEVMMMGLEKGTKYFYRTFAMNAEGVGYGVVKDFVMQEHASGPSWAKAQPGAAANWWTSPWFGSFYMNDGNAWVMHSELGWLYPMASGDKGVWLWMEQLGWLWTDEEFYPFLYQNSSAGWLLFLRGKPRYVSSSTITGMNDGCRWTVENSLTEFILPFYHAKY